MSVESILASLKAERDKLEAAIRALEGISTSSIEATSVKSTSKKRVLSAAARKKIADAQHRRWARQKNKKRVLSSAARKKISDAQHKRWAAQKKEKGAA